MTQTPPDRTPAARLVDELARDFAPAERTVPAMLARQAERYAEKPLVSSGGQSWTYAQALAEAGRFGATLRAAGIERGDRVALICSNRLDFLRVFLGCAWIGAVSVPINTASRGHQLQHILSNSAARLLIVEGAFAGNLDHLDMAALPLETIWTIDAETPLRFGKIVSAPVPTSTDICEAETMRPRDMLTILYTSGTTGPSKGVCCPHAQYFWWGANTAALLGLGRADVLQSTLPLFHTNALNTFFQALLMGVSVTYEKRFSASDFYAALKRSDATATYVLGAMVPILLSRPRGPEERAHRVTVALAPGVPARFHTEFTERTGIHLIDGWGSTETNFVLGTTTDKTRPGTMGPVFDGFQARVVDGDDNDVPDGTPEITWAIHKPAAQTGILFGGGINDALPARGELGARVRSLVEIGQLRMVTGLRIASITATPAGLVVSGDDTVLDPVDEIIAATGFRPDLDLLAEVRLSLDPAVEAPTALAPLIDPNLHSCGTVRPHGARELAQPEHGFYFAGMKSYGRAPTFLMMTGYEQVRSIVADIAGDKEAAERVELVLPETGVCSHPLAAATTESAGCCGGPAPADADVCCNQDAEVKAAGGKGCGCS